MSVKIKDVAQLAQVSSATVSRVLAGKPHVSQEVRQRVLSAVEQLEYRPSRLARSLRVQRSATIGVIVSDIENPFFTSLVRAVEDVAYKRGLGTIICNTDEIAEKEAMYLELMRAEKVTGVITSPTSSNVASIQGLLSEQVPVVAVNRRIEGADIDTVSVDNVRAASDLTAHLISNGHTHIGLVVGLPNSTTSCERREGYVRVLEKHGLPVREELIRHVVPQEQPGYAAAQRLLDLTPRPTAIVASNGLLLMGGLRAILERHLAVPDDVAVAGFDEMRWMSVIAPGLTVIEQPVYQLGLAAAGLLLERLDNPTRPAQEVVLKGQLIVRQSSGPHRCLASASAADALTPETGKEEEPWPSTR